jgi:hypothetical protein
MSIDRIGGVVVLMLFLTLGGLGALRADSLRDGLLGFAIIAFIGLVAAASFEVRHRLVLRLHGRVGRLVRERPRESEELFRRRWFRFLARRVRD